MTAWLGHCGAGQQCWGSRGGVQSSGNVAAARFGCCTMPASMPAPVLVRRHAWMSIGRALYFVIRPSERLYTSQILLFFSREVTLVVGSGAGGWQTNMGQASSAHRQPTLRGGKENDG